MTEEMTYLGSYNNQLEILNNLVNILIRYAGDFFLVVNCKKVNASIRNLNDGIQSNNPKPASFTTAFTLNAETDLALTASKRNSYFRVLHQLVLKTIDVISKRTITLGQAFGLTAELFRIVESHHTVLCLCSQFFNKCVEIRKVLTCKATFLSLAIPSRNSPFNKSLLFVNNRCGRNQFVNGNAFDCTQNLFQTWNKACIFNIQNNLRHNSTYFDFSLQN